jgi:hypothetical protein
MRQMVDGIGRLGLALLFCVGLNAQVVVAGQSDSGSRTADETVRESARNEDARTAASKSPSPSVEERLSAMEQMIQRQQQEIRMLRELLESRITASAVDAGRREAVPTVLSSAPATAGSGEEAAQADQTPKKVDELYKKFGSITLSGDVRFRTETFTNQGFDNPADAPSRVRLRIRARLAIDGVINRHLDWGARVATGNFTDPVSTNQTFTDFFERKPIALERAFVRFDSKGEKVGVQLVGGKFEPTFRRSQLVWDDDVNVEGASEAIYFKTTSSLKQIKLVAFQLPFDEQSALKDGVLYGGQAQTDWTLSTSVSANVNVAFYNWVRADRVLLALGASPFQVNGGINNNSGVSGGQNGALGTSNRVIRTAAGTPIGFLADFKLFDVLANITWQARQRIPVTFTFDYVRNLSNRIDDERNGYWGTVQVGQTRERGDWMLGYGFTRIEQDAVLVPFNFSDILASNSRVHMPTFAYQVAKGVTFQWTGLLSQRVNQVFPLSPVNRVQNRMHFEVVYKF